MEAFVMELEDVIDHLLLAAEKDKLFVNCDNARVALWYKTTEPPCTPTTNNDPKPDPNPIFFRRRRGG